MDWLFALSIVAIVGALTVSIVVLWAYGHLRQQFQQTTLRHAQHMKRMIDMIDKLQSQLETANSQINLLTDQSGRLTKAVTGLMDKRMEDGEAPGAEPPTRLLH